VRVERSEPDITEDHCHICGCLRQWYLFLRTLDPPSVGSRFWICAGGHITGFGW